MTLIGSPEYQITFIFHQAAPLMGKTRNDPQDIIKQLEDPACLVIKHEAMNEKGHVVHFALRKEHIVGLIVIPQGKVALA